MRYEESFKQHCVNLVVKEGRIKVSVTKEFNLSQGIIKRWIVLGHKNRYRKKIDFLVSTFLD